MGKIKGRCSCYMFSWINLHIAASRPFLISQMDLAAEEAVRQAEAHIRAINSRVHIVRTRNCQVDLKLVLDR